MQLDIAQLILRVLGFQFFALRLCLTGLHQPQVQLRNGDSSGGRTEGWVNRRHQLRNSFLKLLDVISNSFQPILQALGILKVIKDLVLEQPRLLQPDREYWVPVVAMP